MAKTKNRDYESEATKSVLKSGPDGETAEQRLNGLPPEQRELAQESARLADLCQYYSQEKMDIPAEIVDRIRRLSRLEVVDRIRAVKEINQGLMEYLNRANKGPQIRQ